MYFAIQVSGDSLKRRGARAWLIRKLCATSRFPIPISPHIHTKKWQPLGATKQCSAVILMSDRWSTPVILPQAQKKKSGEEGVCLVIDLNVHQRKRRASLHYSSDTRGQHIAYFSEHQLKQRSDWCNSWCMRTSGWQLLQQFEHLHCRSSCLERLLQKLSWKTSMIIFSTKTHRRFSHTGHC